MVAVSVEFTEYFTILCHRKWLSWLWGLYFHCYW